MFVYLQSPESVASKISPIPEESIVYLLRHPLSKDFVPTFYVLCLSLFYFSPI